MADADPSGIGANFAPASTEAVDANDPGLKPGGNKRCAGVGSESMLSAEIAKQTKTAKGAAMRLFRASSIFAVLRSVVYGRSQPEFPLWLSVPSHCIPNRLRLCRHLECFPCRATPMVRKGPDLPPPGTKKGRKGSCKRFLRHLALPPAGQAQVRDDETHSWEQLALRKSQHYETDSPVNLQRPAGGLGEQSIAREDARNAGLHRSNNQFSVCETSEALRVRSRSLDA